MRIRTRHPFLAAAACKVYNLTIWTYPTGFVVRIASAVVPPLAMLGRL